MEKQNGNGTTFYGRILTDGELTRLVSAEMIKMGFVPSLKGFPCMRELVLLALKEQKVDKLMKMYDTVAEKFGTKGESLERNARTLVSKSYYHDEGFANLYGYFGLRVTYTPPTVGQILALFTEYMAAVLFDKNFAF